MSLLAPARSEIDCEDDCCDREADERAEPDAHGQSKPFTPPLRPTGDRSGGRSTRSNEADSCPDSCARGNDSEPLRASRCEREAEDGQRRAGHHCQNESDQTSHRRRGTPQGEHARESRHSHRDECSKRPIGSNDAKVVFDAFGNCTLGDRRFPDARPGSRRGCRLLDGSARRFRSRSRWDGNRGTHTRSARSGHRPQDSATLTVGVRHTCL